MAGHDQEIQELKDLVNALQAENLELKQQHRQEADRRDIRDAASEMLWEGQARYRTVFENSLLGNKIIGADLIILQVNQRLVDMLGFSDKSELVGREILEFAHQDYLDDWRILQKKLWSKKLPSFSLETCLIHKNGNKVYVNVTSILFRDGAELLGYTVIEDISGRKDGFDLLRVREKQFRTITNAMPQQVWTATPDGKLNFVNSQVCDYFGQDAIELKMCDWQHFIHPDDKEKCRTKWARSLETGRECVMEFRLRSKEGDYKWYLGRAVPLRDDDDQITLWLGTNTDINTQKENERQKDEFMSIASHELKTPLTSIKLYNQLSRKIGDPAKQHEFIEKTVSHIDRLERLIGDLLDVTKITAGKISYNRETFDFEQLLREVVSGYQMMVPSHQLEIAASEPVLLTADRHRIEQVLNNLLGNAVKYSPTAEKVVIKAQVVADTVIVSVQDFGIGIAEQELNKLFDRYYRADNAAMRFEGLGLGLFISAEILKRHNGSLWIESEQGKGSTFFFILPLNGQKLLTEIDTDHQTYYFANYITVQYHPETGELEADWLGYQNLESVQKGCSVILDLLKKNQCKKVLNDNSKVMGNWSEAADWSAEYWFPAMAAAGLKRFAWIYSPSAFSRLAADKSSESHSTTFKMHFFTAKEEAIQWLNGQLEEIAGK